MMPLEAKGIHQRPAAGEYHGDGKPDLPRRHLQRAECVSRSYEAAEQRHIWRESSRRPLGRSGKRRSLLSAHDRTRESAGVVYALGLDGIIHDTLPQSNREALVTGSITHGSATGIRSRSGRTTSTKARRTAAPAA